MIERYTARLDRLDHRPHLLKPGKGKRRICLIFWNYKVGVQINSKGLGIFVAKFSVFGTRKSPFATSGPKGKHDLKFLSAVPTREMMRLSLCIANSYAQRVDLITCQALEIFTDDHSYFLTCGRTAQTSWIVADQLMRKKAKATFVNHSGEMNDSVTKLYVRRGGHILYDDRLAVASKTK
ncbi:MULTISPECIES: hypothetical protein [Rhizobium]|uniref:hypothetical protein n=1 Tax=Rhizobium TaxID=379 RepID=UPI001C935B3B|nr:MULTISPECIES: hypothetical protein [Rhizobium]MBY4612612.1 hypothetical protein [Rhizobium redzepovicii]ULJ82802.1 hypothetical protein MF410_35765 [Rhizobium sp. C104]